MPTISYADVLETTPLPIDAANLVSKATVVVAGNRAGLEPERIANVQYQVIDTVIENLVNLPYISLPAAYEYEAAEDADYQARQVFALPDYVAPFLEPDEAAALTDIFTSGLDTPSAIYDGEPDTFAESTGANASVQYTILKDDPAAGLCIGFRCNYELSGNAVVVVEHRQISTDTEGDSLIKIVSATYELAATDDAEGSNDVYAVLLPDIRMAQINHDAAFPWELWRTTVSVEFAEVTSGDKMTIYGFYPLILDLAVLERIAVSNIRLPAVKPQRVTVKGYVAPGDSLTITGFPGGDLTAPIASLEYPRNSRDGEVTVIALEQDASSDEPDAGEARRAFARAVVGRIQSGTYGLTMGARL
jgi:hypothetical protein